jgi:hypothetical protein
MHFRAAYFCSAPFTMVRNLYNLNLRLFKLTLSCTKWTGPGESILMAMAVKKAKGARITSKTADTKMSIPLLIATCHPPIAPV